MSSMLLVGGLADGERRDIPDGHQYHEVPVFQRLMTGLPPPDVPIVTRHERYRRTLMCHETGKQREFIEFFRLATLSEYDALRLMLLNYTHPDDRSL